MDQSDLRAFEDEVRALVPGFRVAYKDETGWMKALAAVVKPFNPDFLTRYTTTVGKTVYFPSRQVYEASPKGSITVLAHELVHLLDDQAHPWLFRLSYLFPQALAPLAFVAYLAMAGKQGWPLGVVLGGALAGLLAASWVGSPLAAVVFLTGGVGGLIASIAVNGWVALLLLLGLALLGPWPAPGRVHWEKRGYAMNLAMAVWSLGTAPRVYRDGLVYYFVGPPYYYMAWRKAAMDAWAQGVAASVQAGTWTEQPYLRVREFLAQRGKLHG